MRRRSAGQLRNNDQARVAQLLRGGIARFGSSSMPKSCGIFLKGDQLRRRPQPSASARRRPAASASAIGKHHGKTPCRTVRARAGHRCCRKPRRNASSPWSALLRPRDRRVGAFA